MADVTFVSTSKPALLAEAARQFIIADASLPTPNANVTMSFGVNLLTINASLPTTIAIDASNGKPVISIVDQLADFDPVLTGTPMASKGIDSLGELINALAVEIDNDENVKQAAGTPNPSGVGTTFSYGTGSVSITAVLPYVISLNSSGAQVATVSNYLA